MATQIAKVAAKKLLKDQIKKRKDEGKGVVSYGNDPHFEEIQLPKGKKMVAEKTIPDFIPEHDAKILVRIKDKAYGWDMKFSFFGMFRFGWGSLLGLVLPEIGDVIDVLRAISIWREMSKVDVKLGFWFHFVALWNIFIDFVVGLIPVVGDIFDTAFRANTKNAHMLEKKLVKHYGKHLNDKQQRRSLLELPQDLPTWEQLEQTYGPAKTKTEQDMPETRPAETKKSRWWQRGTADHDVEKGQVQGAH